MKIRENLTLLSASIILALLAFSGCSKPEPQPYYINSSLVTNGYSKDGVYYFTSSKKINKERMHYTAKVRSGEAVANKYASEQSKDFIIVTPSDGIPAVAIYMEMRNPDTYDFVTTVVCDDDFKERYPTAWIHWGEGYRQHSQLTYTNEIRPGIYEATVSNAPKAGEDTRSFWGIGFSGIMVSDLSPEQVAARQTDGLIITFK